MDNSVIRKYRRGISRLERLVAGWKRVFATLSLLRFFSFAGIFALPAILVYTKLMPISTGSILLASLPGMVAFGFFFFRHSRTSDDLKYAGFLKEEYQECIARLTPGWEDVLPSTEQPPGLSPEKADAAEHAYGSDLGLFGPFSLFQFLDRTSTPGGRARLADLLLSQPDETAEDDKRAAQRADAVTELSRLTVLRGRFRRSGRFMRNLAGEDASYDTGWLKELQELKVSPLNRLLLWPARLLPVLTLLSYIFFETKILPAYFMLTLPLQVVLFVWAHIHSRRAAKLHFSLNLQLQGFEKLFSVCAGSRPRSELIRDFEVFGDAPYREIKTLARIAGYFAMRMNPFAHGLLGIVLAYEINLMHSLEGWLKRNGDRVEQWLLELREVDALLCLGEFAHDHPTYVRPVAGDSGKSHGPLLSAKEMAHPLLPADNRIGNSFEYKNDTRLWLISGSNMSGKSTFLRTLGINLLLAMLGAPVCAREFRFRPLRIYTSINQTDDLRKSISLFYAEVRRIRFLLDAARDSGPPVFFLVDEMLRGTNTRERQVASRSILNQFLQKGMLGMVTTHDLELLGECGRAEVECYHFQESIVDDRMRFDYRLKEGPVAGTNALKVLELEGIVIKQ